MMAEIKYVMQFLPRPWDKEKRKEGMKIWCLCKMVEPVSNRVGAFVALETIAIFDSDSEALTFQEHCMGGGSVEPCKIFEHDMGEWERIAKEKPR